MFPRTTKRGQSKLLTATGEGWVSLIDVPPDENDGEPLWGTVSITADPEAATFDPAAKVQARVSWTVDGGKREQILDVPRACVVEVAHGNVQIDVQLVDTSREPHVPWLVRAAWANFPRTDPLGCSAFVSFAGVITIIAGPLSFNVAIPSGCTRVRVYTTGDAAAVAQLYFLEVLDSTGTVIYSAPFTWADTAAGGGVWLPVLPGAASVQFTTSVSTTCVLACDLEL